MRTRLQLPLFVFLVATEILALKSTALLEFVNLVPITSLVAIFIALDPARCQRQAMSCVANVRNKTW
jgi:hypothetical protein